MRPSRSLLIFGIFLLVSYGKADAESNDTIWKGFSVMCTSDGNGEIMNRSVSCHGVRLVRKIVQKFLEEVKKKRSLEILDGVSLIEKRGEDMPYRNARVINRFGQFGSALKFLENRELRIKLPSLLPRNLESAIEASLPSVEQGRKGSGGGFGGGKKGDGGVMMMALMMGMYSNTKGKMMAAMGFGALAFLAMKALMVSSLALMLSLIIAAKKLAGGKEEDSHHVVYAQEVGSSHHRRRRSTNINFNNFNNQPYRGHMIIPTEIQKLQS